eukprot:jgi/Ulvmu1/6400/UM003_0028.1
MVVEVSERDLVHSLSRSLADGAFERACARAGVAPVAAKAWTELYVRPRLVCNIYLFSALECLVPICVVYTSGYSRWVSVVHVPLIISIVALLVQYGGMWRLGPLFAKMQIAQVLIMIAAANVLMIAVTSFIGPRSLCPFSSRFLASVVFAWLSLGMNVAAKFGGMPADHPHRRDSHDGRRLISALTSTARTVDGFTDMAIVRTIMDYALLSEACFWFGRSTTCGRVAVLAYVAGALVAADWLITLILIFQGGWLRENAKRKLISLHVCGLICEIGMVLIALTTALSKAEHPDLNDEGSTATFRSQILLAAFSCLFSIITSCLSILGLGDMLVALRRISAAAPVQLAVSAVSSTARSMRRSVWHPMGTMEVVMAEQEQEQEVSDSGGHSVTRSRVTFPASARDSSPAAVHPSPHSTCSVPVQSKDSRPDEAIRPTSSMLDALCVETPQSGREHGHLPTVPTASLTDGREQEQDLTMSARA